MRLLARRKVTPVLTSRQRLLQARAVAPTLNTFLPAVTRVCVELTFHTDVLLAQAPQTFTIFPTAQAHFVYACPFGDCDGAYDLNDVVSGTALAQLLRTEGVLICSGRRLRRDGMGPQCGQVMAYAVTVDSGAGPADNSAA